MPATSISYVIDHTISHVRHFFHAKNMKAVSSKRVFAEKITGKTIF